MNIQLSLSKKWFQLAKDVASWIDCEVSNVSKLVKNVDDDEKITTRTNNTRAIFLNEDGLYYFSSLMDIELPQ